MCFEPNQTKPGIQRFKLTYSTAILPDITPLFSTTVQWWPVLVILFKKNEILHYIPRYLPHTYTDYTLAR